MPSSEIRTSQPLAALRRYIARYVGYRLQDYPVGVHRGLPTKLLTFVVQLDRPRAFVAGLRTSAVLLPHQGFHYGIAIELTVRGARALLATPAGALTELVVDLSDLLGPSARSLSDRLATCCSWEGRFALLDELFLTSLDRTREPAPEVVHAWGVLARSSADIKVESLARSVGWSRRHFSEIFGREVGLPPRQLLRVIRFERSCQLVRAPGRAAMTEIALRSGYFDHAHLLHEWHALAGARPDQWLAEELLSVQAGATGNE